MSLRDKKGRNKQRQKVELSNSSKVPLPQLKLSLLKQAQSEQAPIVDSGRVTLTHSQESQTADLSPEFLSEQIVIQERKSNELRSEESPTDSLFKRGIDLFSKSNSFSKLN